MADRSERLLNLVFVLLSARRPVTRQRLRDTISEYSSSPSDEAFERMFERDKSDLRDLGIPIETLLEDGATADEAGYRIPRESFELPPIELDAEAMAAVRIAALAWNGETMGGAAARALQKLEAAGLRANADETMGFSGLAADEPAFVALVEAAARKQAVKFRYRRPDQTEAIERHLQPWGVVEVGGRWYVVGHDLMRDGVRAFRLSRMSGGVKAVGAEQAFIAPEGLDLASLVTSAQPSGPQQTAVLAVLPDRCRALRGRATVSRAGTERDELEVAFDDEESFAGELVALADAVVVVAPESLRATVVTRLRQAAGVGRG